MESWSFGLEGKGYLFPEEMDTFARSRKGVMDWDNKNYFNCGKESVDSMEFMPFNSNNGVEMLSGMIGTNNNDSSSNIVASPTTCLITSSSSWGERESSGSKFSSPVTESNSQDSSLIALKLGMLAGDSRYGQQINRHSKENSKRGGLRGSYSHNPTCQVYGCNMDLSSSKDYHKRHRVCDAHSKTPIVIVNGIEQRFCQQCSRFGFDLLSKFRVFVVIVACNHRS